ncbi:hypothetical protein RB594_004576 [Gaeumannomyces avenae]
MKVFYPNYTLPDDEAGIVATPDMRGTIDIIWSCLAAVLLCTWVVLHENVPAEGDTREARFRARLLLESYLVVQKGCSFLYAVFAPEIFTGKAIMGLYFARHVRVTMNRAIKEGEDDWTICHAFLANMGGFAIDFDDNTKVPQSSSDATVDDRTPTTQDKAEKPTAETSGGKPAGLQSPRSTSLALTNTPPRQLEEQQPRTMPRTTEAKENASDNKLRKLLLALYQKHKGDEWVIFKIPKVVQGRWKEDDRNVQLIRDTLETSKPEHLGFHSPESYVQNLKALRGNTWVVDGIQLEYARRVGIVSKIPRVTKDEIMDKSKGDWVSKGLAILQVTWLWIQLAVRAATGLTATQLEVMTAAFATCSVVTYAFYFEKPKDVKTRIRIRAAHYPRVHEMADMGRLGPKSVWYPRVYLQIGNDNLHQREGQNSAAILIVLCAFIGMVFGSVHFACWNSHFPTRGEQVGWRVACGILLVVPMPIAGFMLLDDYLDGVRRKKRTKFQPGKVLKGIVLLGEGIYVLARLFMMVEAARSLYYQPKESFVATWAFLPHL